MVEIDLMVTDQKVSGRKVTLERGIVMSDLRISTVGVFDMSNVDETAASIRKASAEQRKLGAGAEVAELIKFVGMSKLGWSHDTAVTELGHTWSAGHTSKGLLVVGILEHVATGEVPDRYKSDAKVGKFESAVETFKGYWAAEATKVREAGGEFPTLVETALGVTGEDGDVRRRALCDLYKVTGAVSGSYDVATGRRVHESLVEPEGDDEPEGDNEGDEGDEDHAAKLRAMLTTARQYAEKHGVSLPDVLALAVEVLG